MDIKDKIRSLKERLLKKNEMACPTPVLLYLAAQWNYHSSVSPWYEHIKELTGGVNKNSLEFHAAVITGMYPEIESASKYFAQVGSKFVKENRTDDVYEARKSSYGKKIKKGLQQIEKDVIMRFGLKATYDIYNLSDEQKNKIKDNLRKTTNKNIDETLSECLPVVQIIAQELRKNVQLEGEHPLAFSDMMKYLDYALKRGADKNTPPERNDYTFPQERYNIAKQIFDMQKTGIISDNFQVKKWNEFISSDLIQNFPYRGEKYNLEKVNNSNALINREYESSKREQR